MGPPKSDHGVQGTAGLLRGALLLLSLQAPQLLGGQAEGGGVTLHCTEEEGMAGDGSGGKSEQFCAWVILLFGGAVQ